MNPLLCSTNTSQSHDTVLLILNILFLTHVQSQKTDCHVFLLDRLTVCCWTKAKGGAKERQYRLKEKINIRKVTLVDLLVRFWQ